MMWEGAVIQVGRELREKCGGGWRYGGGGWMGFAATGEIPTAALQL
jgi:hypothetical protein